MDLGLHGSRALITGGSRGIGFAVARGLAAEGAAVGLIARDADGLARLLYERCGFTLTGERQPLPSHPALGEVGMTFPL